MPLSQRPYRGTRDFFPQEKRKLNYLFSKMHEAARIFGHENYDGPLLEDLELYRAKSGEEIVRDQIYAFEDRGKRSVAIRPEMTPTLARMASQVYRQAPLPLRWYSLPNLYRYERPQRGRLREHWQLNCDILGHSGIDGEIEIIELAVFLMESLGADHTMFEIRYSDRKLLSDFFQGQLNIPPTQIQALWKAMDKGQEDPSIKEKLAHLPDFLKASSGPFRQFHEKITSGRLAPYVRFDPHIVRGLDYYTGMVFEIFDKGPQNQRAICGGGSYEHLLALFGGGSVLGTGFGLGEVTLQDFLEAHGLFPNLEEGLFDLYGAFQEEGAKEGLSELVAYLRRQGVSVVFHPTPIKIKKALQLAHKKHCRFVSLVGEDELQERAITFKNLSTAEQKSLPMAHKESILSLLRAQG